LSDPPYTHAGGLVVRARGDSVDALLVRPSTGEEVWVLPKGHIETGETTEQAAVREVAEEAGVRASIREPLGELSYVVGGKNVRVLFYVMDYDADAAKFEDRERRWVPLAEASRVLSHDNAKRLAQLALERAP